MTTTYLLAWIGAAIAFALLDLIWLGFIAKDFYMNGLGDLRSGSIQPIGAIGFYLVVVTGTVFFAIRPALLSESWTNAAMLGAAFGLCCYATYDLTNWATLKNWPAALTFVDITWGTFLTAAASTAGYFAATAFRAT